MTTVEYKIEKIVEEEYKIDIEDIHDCYLYGKNRYGQGCYLGIYVGSDKRLHIVEIDQYCITKNESKENTGIYTQMHISNFCEKHHYVRISEREKFEVALRECIERVAIN